MRARTRLRVSAPTSAQPRTTLDTVITETFRSCAMSFRRTGELGGLDIGQTARPSAGAFREAKTRVYQDRGRGLPAPSTLRPCGTLGAGTRSHGRIQMTSKALFSYSL